MQKKPTQIGDVIFVNNDNSKPCQYVNIYQDEERNIFHKLWTSLKYASSQCMHKCLKTPSYSKKSSDKYCHVALCIFPNIFIEVGGQGGVSCRHIKELSIADSLYLVRPTHFDNTQTIKFCIENISHISTPYHANFSKDNGTKIEGFFCSEYVIKMLKQFDLIEPTINDKETPDTLYRHTIGSNLWEEVAIDTINLDSLYVETSFFEDLFYNSYQNKLIKVLKDHDHKSFEDIRYPTSIDGFQNPDNMKAKFITKIYNHSKKFSHLTPNGKNVAMLQLLYKTTQHYIKLDTHLLQKLHKTITEDLEVVHTWQKFAKETLEIYSFDKFISQTLLIDIKLQRQQALLQHSLLQQIIHIFMEISKQNIGLNPKEIETFQSDTTALLALYEAYIKERSDLLSDSFKTTITTLPLSGNSDYISSLRDYSTILLYILELEFSFPIDDPKVKETLKKELYAQLSSVQYL